MRDKNAYVTVHPIGNRKDKTTAYVVGMTQDNLGVVFAFDALPPFLVNVTWLRFTLEYGFIVLAFRPHTGANFVEVHTGQEIGVKKAAAPEGER